VHSLQVLLLHLLRDTPLTALAFNQEHACTNVCHSGFYEINILSSDYVLKPSLNKIPFYYIQRSSDSNTFKMLATIALFHDAQLFRAANLLTK